MLSFVFVVLMFVVFGKMLKFAIKATWGIAKIVVSLILLPFVLLGLALSGLIMFALLILIIIGVIAFIVLRD